MRLDWEKIWLVAQMWYCGAEVCDCTQPQIDEVSPNYEAGYPWIKRKEVWRGTFHTEADIEELKQQNLELITIAKEYGIDLDKNLYGRKEKPTPPTGEGK